MAMRTLRNRVRAIALIWLLGQVASLAAFIPDNCCVSHVEEKAAKEKQESCHESEAAPEPEPGDACPMKHDTGAACAMHGGKSSDRCAMTNACDGPGAQLVSLFAYLGAIERPLATGITLGYTAAFIRPPAPPLFQVTTPDAPPPKA
jgi:hypothetical protein